MGQPLLVDFSPKVSLFYKFTLIYQSNEPDLKTKYGIFNLQCKKKKSFKDHQAY